MIEEIQTRQTEIVHQFMNLVANNRLSHAYLFTGEAGAGQLEVAELVAMRLFCKNVQNNLPCGKCPECLRILNQEHPDVVMAKPEGLSIKVDQIRFIKSEFSKSAVEGQQKVFIIEAADKMTIGAANSLLKFIEEPAGSVVTFLISPERQLVLPTIVSRTQVVEFNAVANNLLTEKLTELGVAPSQQPLLLSLTNDLQQIKEWNKDDWFTKIVSQIIKWDEYLIAGNPQAFSQIQMKIMPLVTNREQQRLVLQLIVALWQETLLVKYGQVDVKEIKFQGAKQQLTQATSMSTEQLLLGLKKILNMKSMVDVNVSFQNMLESTTLSILAIFE
ncbi:DNA polymerase III subunit delta [Lentilactobacillus senioris DSM 24302 = JCM 17472]|uniref:DNA polymerase III subunit delta n=1 Tax=Lentilactobacillus senioris DSM 24302 = JCM 17472 TaxID=1423802 RepID=A0A0R2CZB6_9LACO|nr:DNA polymerase III subunit delta' [Lentilactobacillus senioris]KRM93433.1 DNA polymerase III subunit delta [Lentilactobacillus senioris DSM 24302 = JCM 17472]